MKWVVYALTALVGVCFGMEVVLWVVQPTWGGAGLTLLVGALLAGELLLCREMSRL